MKKRSERGQRYVVRRLHVANPVQSLAPHAPPSIAKCSPEGPQQPGQERIARRDPQAPEQHLRDLSTSKKSPENLVNIVRAFVVYRREGLGGVLVCR